MSVKATAQSRCRWGRACNTSRCVKIASRYSPPVVGKRSEVNWARMARRSSQPHGAFASPVGFGFGGLGFNVEKNVKVVKGKQGRR